MHMAKILLAERNKRVGAPHRGSVGCSVCSVQQVGLTAVPGGVYRSTYCSWWLDLAAVQFRFTSRFTELGHRAHVGCRQIRNATRE